MSSRAAAVSLLLGCCMLAFSASALAETTPHTRAALDTSICAACHVVHAASGGMLLRTAHANPDGSDVCEGCHGSDEASATNVLAGDVDSFSQPSGHVLSAETSGSPSAAVTGCDACHDVHGDSSSSRGIPQRLVNGVAVSSASKELCLACHDAGNSWYGDGYPATSAPTRDATGFPVAGTWPGPATYNSPSNPHRLIPESTQTVGASKPVRRESGDCLYCHGAHGGANAYDGLVTTFTVSVASTLASDQAQGSYAALCFNCHGGAKPSWLPTSTVDIKQFATRGGGSSGHSIVTSGGLLPVGAPLPCFECHTPHGSKRGNASLISDERGASLDTTNAADVRAFCFTCHTTSDTSAGWDSDTATYTPVASAATVVGLPRDGGVLHLPDNAAHSVDSTQSCYDCHGDSYASGGHNVHDPSDGASPTATFAIAIVPSFVTSFSVEATASIDPSATVDATATVTPVDLVAPMTTSDAQAAYTGSATITLTAVDDVGGSGVAQTYYSLDGAAATTGTVATVSAEGTHTLTFWSIDMAGNAEQPSTVTFSVEPAPPPPVDQQVSMDLRRGYWIASRAT